MRIASHSECANYPVSGGKESKEMVKNKKKKKDGSKSFQVRESCSPSQPSYRPVFDQVKFTLQFAEGARTTSCKLVTV